LLMHQFCQLRLVASVGSMHFCLCINFANSG
jgi:hypothetical protein